MAFAFVPVPQSPLRPCFLSLLIGPKMRISHTGLSFEIMPSLARKAAPSHLLVFPTVARPQSAIREAPNFPRLHPVLPVQPIVQPAGRPPPVPPPPFLAAGQGSLRICMRRPLEFPNGNRRWLLAGTTVVGLLCPPLGCYALARCTTFQLCSNISKWDDSVAKKAYGWSGTFQRNLRAIESKAASNSESSLA